MFREDGETGTTGERREGRGGGCWGEKDGVSRGRDGGKGGWNGEIKECE